MTDLGGGVTYRPDDDPASEGIPTCPYCGQTGRADRINEPTGRYFCSCGSLFSGSDREWHSLAAKRRQDTERRTRRQQEAS